jgi:hypothetical protein
MMESSCIRAEAKRDPPPPGSRRPLIKSLVREADRHVQTNEKLQGKGSGVAPSATDLTEELRSCPLADEGCSVNLRVPPAPPLLTESSACHVAEILMCASPVSLNAVDELIHGRADYSASKGGMTYGNLGPRAPHPPYGAEDVDTQARPQSISLGVRRGQIWGPGLRIIPEEQEC